MYHNITLMAERRIAIYVRSLARFLYCLRSIVSIITGQRPRRQQCDTSRRFFLCASCARRATLQSYLIRHKRNVSSPCKQLFLFVGENKRDFPARDCSALLHRVLAYYLCTPLMESRISLRNCSFRSLLADTVKMKVNTRCYCSRALKYTSLVRRWQVTKIFMVQPYIEINEACFRRKVTMMTFMVRSTWMNQVLIPFLLFVYLYSSFFVIK